MGSALPYNPSCDYLGIKIKGDWQNIFHIHPNHTLTLGLEDEEDRLENQSEGIGNPSYNTQGYYLSDNLTLFDRSFSTVSVRYADNNLVGNKVTWSLTEADRQGFRRNRLPDTPVPGGFPASPPARP